MTDPGGKNLVGNLDTCWLKLVSTYLSVAEVKLVCVCLVLADVCAATYVDLPIIEYKWYSKWLGVNGVGS